MTDTPIFSTGALELIRVMAVAGANINRIRSALHTQEGVWFKDFEIIEAGKTFNLEIVPADHAAHGRPTVVPFRVAKPKREPDKIGLVAKGSCPVPKGGYRMGRDNGQS